MGKNNENMKNIQIDDAQINDTIRKAGQLPADKRLWLDGFMEGIIRGWANEKAKQINR